MLDCSGRFTVLTIADAFAYELKFEKGKLKSVAEQSQRKSSKNEGNGKTNGCIDWYLITTIYYADGTSQYFEDYLYTTCAGDCQTTKISNGKFYRTTCGGGGGDGIDYEFAKSRFVSWSAYATSDGYSIVWSHEQLNGTRSTSGVAKFTSINYHTDNVNTTETYIPEYAVWHRYNWVPSISTDKKTASVILTGKLTFPHKGSSADIVIPPATNSWDADREL